MRLIHFSSLLALRTIAACTVLFALAHADATHAAPAASPCAAPECHQFDFWIGDWDVTTPDGKTAGTNLVESILGGCVLQENWSGAGGGHGKSYNIYSAATKRWHQTWVDDHGSLLVLDGEFKDGRMVLTGSGPGAQGGVVINRITWEALADGRVRQTWDTSTDKGKTWSNAFTGLYARKKS